MKLTKDTFERVMNGVANDIRLDYDDGETKEYWVGEKGTTNVRAIYWNEEDQEGEIVSFGKTISELRKDPTFIYALLNDSDVNHGLPLYNKPIPEEEYKRILDWLTCRSNEMPITACGAYNYFDSYGR